MEMEIEQKRALIRKLELEAIQQAETAAALAAELGVEITDERAARGLLWLVETQGKPVVAEAVASLVGGQRAFPLNVARRLGIKQFNPPMGPGKRAEFLKLSVRMAVAAQERDRQDAAVDAARRAARIAP